MPTPMSMPTPMLATPSAAPGVPGATASCDVHGADIRAWRTCVQLSQVELARRLSITKQHLCHIEHDRKGVPPALLHAIVEIIEAEVVSRADFQQRLHRLNTLAQLAS